MLKASGQPADDPRHAAGKEMRASIDISRPLIRPLEEARRDYDRIEAALRFLDERFQEQPSLEETADHLGLSPHHFHRLFRRWAGITPKRFLAYVTAAHARRLLSESLSVLETSFEAGLSGPSRLHDLFVSLEGVTPGEVKSGGEGLEIRHGVHGTPFGPCLLAETERGVCALRFVDAGEERNMVEALAEEWPTARLRRDRDATGATLERILELLAGGGRDRLRVSVQGTNFQVRVWEALLRIPAGRVATYGQVAAAVGRPGASRAVGQAVGANPVPLLIPCHRVIRSTGAFGHYAGGPLRKRAILAWEAAAET